MTQILCFILIPVFYVGALIYGAQSRPRFDTAEARMLRWLSVGLIGFTLLFGSSLLFWAAGPLPAEINTELDAATLDFLALPMGRAAPAFALVTLCCAGALATLWSVPFRNLLARFAFRSGAFQPDASTNVVALVLAFILLALIFGSQAFINEGLVAGEINIEQLLLQAFIFLACAALGVGYPMRRNERQTFARLGLRLPERTDLLFGIGGGVALLIVVILGGILWQLFVTPESFAEQTAFAREFAAAFHNLPLILALAALSAVSEEVLFRGALQPIFGLGATSVFFALFHTQYGYTPSLLLLFIVGAGLGMLRQRYSASAAIIAHFTFNFLQLAGSMGG